ncbi:hypothetical protein HN954_00140 [bacterium]|jgi:cell fate regulator YaaT (PSP1 superfamily)|nr:hypothetical protein [bacterium]MBT6832045.1 hypothetical protein [bacterium]MBT6995826.1 hypothetical protein [bacterium]MBT7772363.1 hypothetical protein [bacterium]
MKIVQVVDLLRHQLVILQAPDDVELEVKDHVLLKNGNDKIVGKIVSRIREIPDARVDETYEFLKKLTPDELKPFFEMIADEKSRVVEAKKCARELKLPMSFFASRCDANGKIFSFFFVADEKVDFRDLLKLMAGKFKKRIHLQRVGARDRAKIVGGFGSCGQPTCCSTFKVELETVPLDSARDQNLMLKNNEKIFGLCGKLKCCLMYELPLYREMRRGLPHLRQHVFVGAKEGRVMGLDILNRKVKVLLDDAEISEIFDADQVSREAPKTEKRKPEKPFLEDEESTS